MDNTLLHSLKNRPHVVILGAGASVATIFNGDKNGNRIYAMADFIDKLKLDSILNSVILSTNSRNLEDVYSELYERKDPECENVRRKLENKIEKYFSTLELSDSPSIYDFLLLSLRNKDLIISFNWDDLLLQARRRVQQITKNLPEMAFLHGNIGVGYCQNDMGYGLKQNRCNICGDFYVPSQLLYPIKKKDYNSSPQLKKQWDGIKWYIENAGYITVFGYGLPNTDVEVKDILERAFITSDNELRFFESIEIIDKPGCDKNILYDKWSKFIKHSHGHYSIKDSFFDSILCEFPRRSVEGHITKNIEGWWGKSSLHFNECISFNDIKELIQPLLDAENNNEFDIK